MSRNYTFQCEQADGLIFIYPGKMSKKDARLTMYEYKKVFTKCKNWSVIEVAQ